MSTDWILWDLIEEHLAEGAFAFRTCRRRLESPSDTLVSLESRFEARLKAHVDGLLVGGTPVAERVLQPELSAPEEPDVARCAIAALALIQQGQSLLVQNALTSSIREVQTGAEQALSLLGPSSIDRWLTTGIGSDPPPAPRVNLLRIAAARRTVLGDIVSSLQSHDPAEAEAAAKAARRASMATHGGALHQLLAASDNRVRDAALETALATNSPYAFARCLELAADLSEPQPTAMLLVGLLGSARHHEILLAMLAAPTHRHAAVRALGFTGNVRYVDTLVPLAAEEDEILAKLAGEAFYNITGLQAPASSTHPNEEGALPALDQDVTASQLVDGPEAELVVPDASTWAQFWAQAAPTIDRSHRLLQGRPWTMPRVWEVLRHGRLRQRHPLALWLRVRTGGNLDLETRALTNQQQQWLRINQPAFVEEALLVDYRAN